MDAAGAEERMSADEGTFAERFGEGGAMVGTHSF